MSLGEVDTLNLLTEKLENLFNDSQGYYESFLDANNLYKNGKLSDSEFFQKLGDYVVAYSALEFLSIKVILELKKSIDRIAGGKAPGGTQSPGLMPGMGSGMMGGGMAGGMAAANQARVGTAGNPAGAPPSIVSAKQGFGDIGTLPSPDPSLVSRPKGPACSACGAQLRPNAKFCTKCGTKAQ
ncbi:MAG: zinc ribbon domain-containing protein [Crenarchaeota archaeon]|nr:MAG: zinc ribbon domain-containing protein [Thermoproteota archaeon]RDJ33260.1 MAG: zinc ribbon domain-containing protein [Thermoproteota archaeon]RDJ36237.1 MAG: zinc ribbon domain-containing protein [Thermoproteota archaeon]RDJ38867.1 MAG: zinc ribbon domain-containing protein [Thermoproteota archaeon]